MHEQCKRTSKQTSKGLGFTSGFLVVLNNSAGGKQRREGSFESRISAKEKNEAHRIETE